MKCQKCSLEHENKTHGIAILRKTKHLCIMALCIVLLALSITGCGDNTGTTQQSDSANQSSKTSNSRETEKIICDNDNIKATFMKMYDPQAGITMYSVMLKIENKGNHQITVNLTDAYANGTAVTFSTSLPVTIAAGKNAVGSFLFGYQNLGIEKIEDITNLEFKICLYDDNYSIISKTDTITLEF